MASSVEYACLTLFLPGLNKIKAFRLNIMKRYAKLLKTFQNTFLHPVRAANKILEAEPFTRQVERHHCRIYPSRFTFPPVRGFPEYMHDLEVQPLFKLLQLFSECYSGLGFIGIEEDKRPGVISVGHGLKNTDYRGYADSAGNEDVPGSHVPVYTETSVRTVHVDTLTRLDIAYPGGEITKLLNGDFQG